MPNMYLDPLTWPRLGVYWNNGVEIYHSLQGQEFTQVGSMLGGGHITRNGTYNFVGIGSRVWKTSDAGYDQIISGLTQVQGVTSNRDNLFVSEIDDTSSYAECLVYDHDGNYQRSFPIAPALNNYGGRVNIAASDTHIACTCNEHGYLYLLDGTLVSTVSVPNISYQECLAITNDRAYFMTYDGAHAYKVMDMSGAYLGDVTTATTLAMIHVIAIEVTLDGLHLLSAEYDRDAGEWINKITFFEKSASGEGFGSVWTQETRRDATSAIDLSRDRGRAV